MQAPSLDLFAVFAAVAEARSFTVAGRELGLSKATVSKRLAELEAALGVQLIARSTRRLSLTEAGERVLAHAQRIREAAEAAREAAGALREAPRGVLKVSAPLSFGVRYLAPLLPAFLAAFPEIRLDLRLEDRTVDLIGEGYDAALRIAEMPDSSLIVRRLTSVRLHVVGAGAYFATHGRPRTPEDLARHACLIYANARDPSVWRFLGPDGARVSVRVSGPLTYDNADVIGPALCAGAGLAAQPDFLCWAELGGGRLERVLTEWALPELSLQLLSPPAREASRKLRAWSDFLHAHFGGGRAPWLALPG